MLLEIQTLAYISCITFLTQFIALLVQYTLNKTYQGIGWWLLGSAFYALGVILLPLVAIKSLLPLAMIANPLIMIGQFVLYIGIVRFLDRKENQWVVFSIFSAFLVAYYYFMFGQNEISGRTLAMTVTFAVISFMTAFVLFRYKDKLFSGSANFTAMVFATFGIFSVIRMVIILISPPIVQYSDQGLILVISFIIPIITGLLWTFGFIIMVNQRLNAENREEKEKLQLIFNTSPDAAVISRLTDGLVVDVNTGFSIMSGYSRAEIINNSTTTINIWHYPEDRETFIDLLKDKGICENQDFIFQRKDGSLLTGRISAKIIMIHGNAHIVSIVHDITKSKQAEESIRESEELYRSILNASPDDITITDMKGRIHVISPAAKTMFGFEPEYEGFIGLHLLDFIEPEDRERAKSNIIKMCAGDSAGPNEYHGVRKDGSIFNIEVKSGLIHDASGYPAKMVFIVRDITERKQAELQIKQLVQQLEIEKKAAQMNANTDSLTGLANRRYFDEVLDKEFHRYKRSGSPISLIMLDVDYFKKYNDTYGHLAGDNCLRQIGNTLKTVVGRVADSTARYGGEEFVVLLPDTDLEGAEALAERIRTAVETLAIPHSASSISKNVTVSLGVATMHTELLSSPEQFIGMADEAMYDAKKGGRNRVCISTENVRV